MDTSTTVPVAVLLLALAAGAVLGWRLGHAAGRAVGLAAAADRLAGARAEAARLVTALEYERQAAGERAAGLDEARDRFEHAFAALSADALEHSSRRFLDLAGETLHRAGERASGELDQRRLEVEHLVAPLQATLAKVEQQLGELEARRAGAYSAVLEQVAQSRAAAQALQSETASLVQALRRPSARGTWGELGLRRVAELAGMLERCDFEVQPTLRGADGDRDARPDMVVHLAGGKQVAVDSKVPLDAYLDAVAATDPVIRDARLAAHGKALRAHVEALSAKAYWQRLHVSPEFVVLFVPQESFLAAALEADPGLLDHAASRRIVLASPTTMVALLRTVAYAWTQSSLADDARAVHEAGRELYQRLSTMGEHVDKLGRSLGASVTAYNRAVGSLEGRVLVTARRFGQAGLVHDELPSPRPVEEAVRPLTAPELVDQEAAAAVVGPASPGAGVDDEVEAGRQEDERTSVVELSQVGLG